MRRLEWAISPASLAHRLARADRLCFLDSATASGDAWSYLAWNPVQEWIVRPGEDRALLPPASGGPERLPSIEDDAPPFRRGWIGWLAYEAASRFDRLLETHAPNPSLPLACWYRHAALLAHRHRDRSWFLLHEDDGDGAAAARRLLLDVDAAMGAAKDAAMHEESAPRSTPRIDRTERASTRRRSPGEELREGAELAAAEHGAAVEQIREWIARGHVYQANLTLRAELDCALSSADLYARLRRTNPATYGAFLPGPDGLAILSSSPELFLRLRGRHASTCPIKGTRPRDLQDLARDSALAAELSASEKDRAELTMIVDLERNDLGRVSRPGTVRTRPFPELTSHARVHHLSATVESELRPEVGREELLAATFPGGSVTGAPKIRAMQILTTLERSPRFVYTGALGWLDDGGDLELSLAIRTMWTREGSSRASFGVGGGIVIDSTPASEWEELEAKASGMLAALEPRSELREDRGAVSLDDLPSRYS